MDDVGGAIAEAPEVDVTPAPIEATPASTPDAQAKPEVAKPEEPQEKQDKRRYPDSWRKTLKFLKENGGEFAPHAQSIHRALGEGFGYREVFPNGVQEARAVRAQLDAVGGPEKVAELHAAYQHMEQLDNSIKAGDPSSLDEIFEMAPEGMAKLLPNIMERVSKMNPEAYQKVVTPVAFSFMTQAGFGITLGDLITSINGNDQEGIKRHTKIIRDWFASGAESATPQEQPPNEWEQKYKAKEAEESQKADAANTEKHITASEQHAGGLIDDALKGYQSKLNLGTEALELLRQDVWKEIQNRRAKDDTFMKPVQAIWNGQRKTWTADPQPFFRMANQKYAKEAADHIVNLRYGHYLKANPAAQGSPTAPVKRVITATPARPVPQNGSGKPTFEQLVTQKVSALRGQ